jgi:hypothetical protein
MKARLVGLLFVLGAIAMFIGGLPWGGHALR